MKSSSDSVLPRTIAVIGGGPAGLMAAEVLSQAGIQVDLYDGMPSVGRKFLTAGKGGLNISHSEPFDRFLSRYGSCHAYIELMLNNFMPEDLRAWVAVLAQRGITVEPLKPLS